MMQIELSNAHYLDAAQSRISANVTFLSEEGDVIDQSVVEFAALPGLLYYDHVVSNGIPVAPCAPTVPAQVTLYQGRAALINAGLFAAVKAAVDAQGQDSLAFQAFEYANHWYRDSPFIAQLASGLGLTAQEVDALFIAAADIV